MLSSRNGLILDKPESTILFIHANFRDLSFKSRDGNFRPKLFRLFVIICLETEWRFELHKNSRSFDSIIAMVFDCGEGKHDSRNTNLDIKTVFIIEILPKRDSFWDDHSWMESSIFSVTFW